jgi:hypothetical protein
VGYPRLTITECVVVVLCLGLAAIFLVPVILNSRGEARSATCQYHEMGLIMATLELVDSTLPTQTLPIEPSQWPQQLAGKLTDPQIVYHCPSDERQPRHEASYGMNNRADQLSGEDGEKGVFLDYDALVAVVVGEGATANWQRYIAPRHFEFVNVAFHDGRVELRDPAVLDPAKCEQRIQFWLPSLCSQIPLGDCQFSRPPEGSTDP